MCAAAHKHRRLANSCEVPSLRIPLPRSAYGGKARQATKRTAHICADLEVMLAAACQDSLDSQRRRALLGWGSLVLGDGAASSRR